MILKKLRRMRKGQVRGIDFALGMLIFIIAFSQVIIVLTHLLVPSIMQMENYSEYQELDKLYGLIYYSKGNPSNWATIGTSSLTDFSLGLSGDDGQLSFSKINRLTSDIADYWKIDYQFVKTSYGLLKDFAISVDSVIKIQLDSFSAGFGSLTVKGKVLEDTVSIENVAITTFALDKENNLFINTTTTKKNTNEATFISTLSVSTSNYYTIVIFANIDEIYETYYVFRIYKPNDSFEYEKVDFNFRPLVLENKEKHSSAIDVRFSSPAITEEAVATVLFSKRDVGKSFYNQTLSQESSLEEGNFYLGTNIPIPTQGLAVVVVQENDGLNYRAGYMGIPMFLTETASSIFGNEEILSGEYIYSFDLLYVRNRLVKCQIWVN
ncbi:MAG: hypothetical protein K9W45_12435 [Candidatus Heimdallarchaeum aukensis]|uniref:Uncharacterized protein n=1 Tax=Candidatus Heimdallarchaeum aukensis TaxID=2876573 RepID=A0A9Y1BKD2_9ARCH|nr:MAG: hypothetical protein K9W45_12435 [Candidatus Heimdallarchaeum aukensis]